VSDFGVDNNVDTIGPNVVLSDGNVDTICPTLVLSDGNVDNTCHFGVVPNNAAERTSTSNYIIQHLRKFPYMIS
jgi:hypothetical protein